MQQVLRPLTEILRLNTELFVHCIVDLSEEDALRRPLPAANHIAFIAVHVIDARFFLRKLLGHEITNPLTDVLSHVNRVEEAIHLPCLDELRNLWDRVSRDLQDCLESVPADLLEGMSPHAFPVKDASLLGGIAFLVQHESYHIGQMALLRKGLGYPAMSYPQAS